MRELLFSLLVLFLFGLPCHALTPEQLQQLSENPRWKTLLHYEPSLWGGEKSAVRSADFFVDPDGRTNPSAELAATIHAMGVPVTGDSNQHAQCRFPARREWLRKVAPTVAAGWPKVLCPNYLAFSFNGAIESISLIFATGYLSNPASYFGHPLIKFNLPRSKMPSSLLDVSMNYGAVTPPHENGFIYAMKGLFGGYEATFSHRQFYYSNHAYGEVELRDMWEYRLNLKPDEVEYFYSHGWEILGKMFPYYFFSQNCASAAAQVTTSATGESLMPRLLPYSIPYTLFDNLVETKRPDGEPLVASVELIPSRQTRLSARFKTLDASEKKAIESVARSNRVTDSLKALPPEQRAETIETLFDYYSFRTALRRSEDPGDVDNPYASVRQELLVERLQLPAPKESLKIVYEAKPPHEGPRPLLTRLGALQSSKYGEGVEFQFRTSAYDLLALDQGRPKNSEVRTLDVTLDAVDRSLWMRQLDLISVTTLNLSQTGLPDDGGWAWDFVTGFESLNLACRDCSLFKIEAGFGKAYALFDRQTVFGMIDVRGQTPTGGSGQLAATPRVGALIDWLPGGKLKTELSVGYRGYLERTDANAALLRFETRYGLSRNWDLRLAYDKHVEELSRLSLSHYW